MQRVYIDKMDFYEKVKGFIMEPSKTFDATKEDTLEDAVKYYVGITAIFSAISAVLFAFVSTLFGSMRGGFGMMSGADFIPRRAEEGGDYIQIQK